MQKLLLLVSSVKGDLFLSQDSARQLANFAVTNDKTEPVHRDCTREWMNLDTAKPPNWCGDETYADPRNFGPVFWPTFHIMAAKYPADPTPDLKKECTNFVNAVGFMLPCNHCGLHYTEFKNAWYKAVDDKTVCPWKTSPEIQTKPGDTEACEDPCANSDALQKLFVRAHNNVSFQVNPCREEWTVEMAQQEWDIKKNTCLHTIMWGDEKLCRSISKDGTAGKDCIDPDAETDL